MTSAVNPVGMASQPLTTVSPRFHIVLSRFSRTALSLRAGGPGPLYRTSVALVLRRASTRGGTCMKALTIISFVAVALIALTGPAAAQVQSVNDADRELVKKAASGGLAEVEFGRIATQRAARPSVRSFGERMVTDHGRTNAELATLARSKGIDVATTLEPAQQPMRDRLNTLSVAAFERASEISADPDIKAWAARTLPMLRDHLALARQVNSEVVLGPAAVPAAIPAAVVIPWCEGAYAPGAGTNFGTCKASR